MKAPDRKRLTPPPPRVMLKNIKRLLRIMAEGHRLQLVLVFVFIIISVLANVAGSLFLEILIDDHIASLLTMETPYFGDLLLT
ncbi:MAG: ABC transporter ATP-binding protein, partial [Eubacteriales bacterium]|nr:ABC transporter ATP-binding protein [Eubacteriales bacterium]